MRQNESKIICHRCGMDGHKSTYCQEEKISESDLREIQMMNPVSQMQNMRVICFNCKQKGHYANKCPLKVNQ